MVTKRTWNLTNFNAKRWVCSFLTKSCYQQIANTPWAMLTHTYTIGYWKKKVKWSTVPFPCLYHIRKTRLIFLGMEWFYWFVTFLSLLSWSAMVSCKLSRELSFFTGRGGRLSVMAGRQFFLIPPFAYGKKFWSPPLPMAKNFGPPLWPREIILVPPPRWRNIPLA